MMTIFDHYKSVTKIFVTFILTFIRAINDFSSHDFYSNFYSKLEKNKIFFQTFKIGNEKISLLEKACTKFVNI